jgi:GNAT superfamily N-acetyltransferase
MKHYQSKPLSPATWPDFARLVEANNGVWGGCWCMWYHGPDDSAHPTPTLRREAKKRLVDEGRAHAALVFDGEACVGWCQFGSPVEITRLHNQKAYLATGPAPPDWRITCFFSGKGHRGGGVASAALQGALQQIAALGGGRVEAYPEDIEDRKASPAFLFNGALGMFERHGFERERRIGKHKWVVTRTVAQAAGH